MKVDFPSFYEQYNLQSLTVEDINYIISRSAEFKAKVSEELGKAFTAGQQHQYQSEHGGFYQPDCETYVNSVIYKLFKQ